MSFEAYLRNITTRTGKTPEELRALARDAGVLTPTMKAGELVAWLKQEFGLGHGHCMAVWAVFKNKGWVQARRRWVRMVSEALLWLFVVFSGIAVGAGLYEMRVNVPRWFPAADSVPVNVEAIRSDDSGRRFWVFVTTVPLTLLTLAGCLAAWSPETARERWWLAGAGAMFVERVGTFGYFIPQLLKLLQRERLTRESAERVARTWVRLNYARAALAFAGWLAALRALSLSI